MNDGKEVGYRIFEDFYPVKGCVKVMFRYKKNNTNWYQKFVITNDLMNEKDIFIEYLKRWYDKNTSA